MAPSGLQQPVGVLLNHRYETISALNHGSFGAVSMAKDIISGKFVALKCLAKPSAGLGLDSDLEVDDRSEELKIHSRIHSHPNVVNLLDSFETDTNSYLVLEYCSMGDLYEAIRQDKGPKQTDHVRAFMYQLLDAVDTLHQMRIFHRDIKPENIFLTDNGDMKLGDFGLATTDVWSYDIAVGSDRYMAPEQFNPEGQGLSTAKADIWSIGICLLNILFARNPFGEPAMSDPLYADFARDRQSLFDVFPNMSQDTFEVLTYCLSVDPEKRSLSGMRDALERAVSFTTDDESLDDFCTENRDVVRSTANREPLRTPSVVSPPIEPGKGFPWAEALHMSSPKHGRNLSVILDTESYSEDLFPASEKSNFDWMSKADTQSLESVVDSGLGLSIPSTHAGYGGSLNASSKPVPIAGSLPAFGGRAGNALSSLFGKKKSTLESKSWSDMWDEEQEELAEHEQSLAAQPQFKSRISQLSQCDSESDGRSTPRAPFSEIKNPSVARPQTAVSKIDATTSRLDFALTTSKYSPPSKRSVVDKWSALGEKRRNQGSPPRAGPVDPAKRRFSPSTWRRNFNSYRDNQKLDHSVWNNQKWSTSTDWRRGDQYLARQSPLQASQVDGMGESDASDLELDMDPSDDESGGQWVGGWKDLHL